MSEALQTLRSRAIQEVGHMMTTIQVAQRLGVDPSRVRQLAIKHRIGRKFGRDWMFSARDVARLAARNTKPGPRA